MAFFLKLFLFSFLFIVSEAQQTHSNISRGSSRTPTNSYWLSNSGLYAFGFYKQGNGYSVGIFLAGIPERTVVWTANRDSPPATGNITLLFSNEGQLILQSEQGQEYIANPLQPASSASILDSGNFVLYNSNGQITWQSFDSPTDTLLPSQRLLTDKQLISAVSRSNHSTGIFRLKMQTDGNLVQYPVGTPDRAAYSYFASWAYKIENTMLAFDASGHLYLMNATISNIKNITDGGFPGKNTTFLMRIDSDGIFRVYSHVLDQKNGIWSIEWSSSNDKCDPKGLCGLNGFCFSSGQEATCRCLPGFEFIDKGNQNLGCFTNFTAESCGNEQENPMTTIEEIPNTIWEDVSYSVLSLSGVEACKQACVEDCNCGAAFYKDGDCRKQRFPLRYGRKKLSESNITLIKVYITKSTIERPAPQERSNRNDILITSVLLVVFGSIMVVVSVVVLHRSRFWRYRRITHKGHEVEFGGDVAPQSYSYEELEKMTDNFKEEIGRGSFGTVYKGIILNSQKVVAVKRLGRLLEEGDIEFQNEMKAIGRTHHKNLVRLLGYCREGTDRLLVYEYMANGSLANLLFEEDENRPRWEERLGIARGIASGLLYLHEECETQIIHCDIKPQNILLDNNRCAKISDFGLAKLLMPDQTRTFTGIRGTRGYVAPEWHKRLPITVKADVFSFGIVLLEIICSRRNVVLDLLEEEEAILEDWVYNCFENGGLQKLVKDEEIDKSQMERMVKVALWCIQEEPSLRPSMKKVLLMLEGIMDIPNPPSRNSFS